VWCGMEGRGQVGPGRDWMGKDTGAHSSQSVRTIPVRGQGVARWGQARFGKAGRGGVRWGRARLGTQRPRCGKSVGTIPAREHGRLRQGRARHVAAVLGVAALGKVRCGADCYGRAWTPA